MQEKSLIISEKYNIFSKIRKFLKNIFLGRSIKNKKIEKSKTISLKVKRKKNGLGKKSKDISYQQYLNEKKKIFDIYNKVKENKIDIDELDIEELEKIEKIMQEELKIKEKKLEDTITELNIDKYKIKDYKGKIEKYKKIVNNN